MILVIIEHSTITPLEVPTQVKALLENRADLQPLVQPLRGAAAFASPETVQARSVSVLVGVPECVLYMYTQIHICVHTYICVSIDVWVHVCIYIHIYVYVCICTIASP